MGLKGNMQINKVRVCTLIYQKVQNSLLSRAQNLPPPPKLGDQWWNPPEHFCAVRAWPMERRGEGRAHRASPHTVSMEGDPSIPQTHPKTAPGHRSVAEGKLDMLQSEPTDMGNLIPVWNAQPLMSLTHFPTPFLFSEDAMSCCATLSDDSPFPTDAWKLLLYSYLDYAKPGWANIRFKMFVT